MTDIATTQLTVDLGARAYPIHIGQGLLARAGMVCASVMPSRRAIVISDATVAALYEAPFLASLAAAGIDAKALRVPAGEASKSFSTFGSLMEALLALAPDRNTTLIALGGGVIGDLVGFAASVLLRGVPFIQVPTTLLAQVDSSVGGKTAINAAQGKNLIGTFYQPRLVLADSDVLATLPARERRAGYAEILKYGLIMDAQFYRWCLAHGAKILAGEVASIQHAVHTACAHKAAVVKADEREADQRALLNFGHTFAHALEAETGFSSALLHGEAVAIGMVMACRLSQRMGLIDAQMETDLAGHFKALGMMAYPQDVVNQRWNAEAIARHFAGDKKAENGALTFVVLKSLGRAVVIKDVDATLARDVVASFL
jgi:3-dehydroquinate synthase